MKWLSRSINVLISSFEQSPLGQYEEMMSMVPRSGAFMEIPTASIISVLMMLSWVNGMDLLMRIATPLPCLNARFVLMMLWDLNLTA